ncbi:hypothetical protein LAWI1_G001535 [Lachnellula willkommii]|uniref:Uncharacterized protein n=1 Tax=Lachnellula willkommii TaxID=215461 RepID=A0A559MJ42_9HELO|nr:hypothetical protein LAWI1_G001535 [Lachnellula willkommii]
MSAYYYLVAETCKKLPDEYYIAQTCESPQSLDDLIASTSHDAPRAELEGTPVPISEILRLRKLRKGRGKFVGGVEFRADSAGAAHDDGARGEESAVMLREREEPEGLDGVARRFAPQIGAVGM